MSQKKSKIFITGGSGYIGGNIIMKLLSYDYEISALTRNAASGKIPDKCKVIKGDALNCLSYQDQISPSDTFIHLVGVSHPGPMKVKKFRSIDLVSIEESVKAAVYSGISHFIYLSVAHPAPVMNEFIKVRIQGENLLMESGIKFSVLRPWYVTGRGHYWPLIFLPVYKLMEIIPFTKEIANRLGLVNINQLTECLYFAVKNPPDKMRIYNVTDIKRFNGV